MHALVVVEQGTRFVERLAMTLTQLTLAAAVIAGSVFVGHELREWREWYWALPPAFEEPAPVPAATEP